MRLLVRYGSHANLTIISGISSVVYSAIEAFEVKGEAVSTSFCAKGRCQTEICGDKVIYGVDTERSIVMRKAVLNKPKSLQGTTLDGLQADSTVYTIVYDGNFMVPRDDKLGKATAGSQRVIKAMGRDGLTDGFETVVIGEDSIHTSRSSADYFVIYYYKRVKTLPQP